MSLPAVDSRHLPAKSVLSVVVHTVLTGLLTGIVAVPIAAQDWSDEVPTTRIHAGPIGLTPTVAVINFGVDPNIFNTARDPTSDVTAMFQPAINAWIRLPRVRVNVNSRVEYSYFRDYRNQRGLSRFNTVRLEVPFNRLRLFGGGEIQNAYDRPGLDVDLRAWHQVQEATAGLDLRIGRSTLSVSGDHSSVTFDTGAVVRGHELATELDHESDSINLAFEHVLTPLTSLVIRGVSQENRFGGASERDNMIAQLTAGLTFKPLALLTGRFDVGALRIATGPGMRDTFQGYVTDVDLGYTLRDVTRIGVVLARSVNYSPDPGARYYLLNTLTASIDHRFGPSWDGTGSFSRSNSTYETDIGLANQVYTYSAGLGYRLRDHLRVSVTVNSFQRVTDADSKLDGFRSKRLSSSFTYGN